MRTRLGSVPGRKTAQGGYRPPRALCERVACSFSRSSRRPVAAELARGRPTVLCPLVGGRPKPRCPSHATPRIRLPFEGAGPAWSNRRRICAAHATNSQVTLGSGAGQCKSENQNVGWSAALRGASGYLFRHASNEAIVCGRFCGGERPVRELHGGRDPREAAIRRRPRSGRSPTPLLGCGFWTSGCDSPRRPWHWGRVPLE
jgi:hypothetical protein